MKRFVERLRVRDDKGSQAFVLVARDDLNEALNYIKLLEEEVQDHKDDIRLAYNEIKLLEAEKEDLRDVGVEMKKELSAYENMEERYLAKTTQI